ncbi:MAG: hypothetical protein ACI4Q3_11005 [Kiritimatiellia bacterium]
MKFDLMFALAAVLVCAPVAATFAAAGKEAAADKEAAAEKTGPTEAEIAKAKKILKANGGKFYRKFQIAKDLAEKSNLPLVALVYAEGDQSVSSVLKKMVLSRKEFKEYAAQNCVLVEIPLKTKDGKTVDTKPIKDPNVVRFIENFGLDEKMASQAASQGKAEMKATDLKNYPAVICVDPLCQKTLFRAGKVDNNLLKENPKAVFGVWLSSFDGFFRSQGFEPTVSAAIQKILDDPMGENGKKK